MGLEIFVSVAVCLHEREAADPGWCICVILNIESLIRASYVCKNGFVNQEDQYAKAANRDTVV
jgi:hypothetical protein